MALGVIDGIEARVAAWTVWKGPPEIMRRVKYVILSKYRTDPNRYLALDVHGAWRETGEDGFYDMYYADTVEDAERRIEELASPSRKRPLIHTPLY
jgi:hypothetical protein